MRVAPTTPTLASSPVPPATTTTATNPAESGSAPSATADIGSTSQGAKRPLQPSPSSVPSAANQSGDADATAPAQSTESTTDESDAKRRKTDSQESKPVFSIGKKGEVTVVNADELVAPHTHLASSKYLGSVVYTPPTPNPLSPSLPTLSLLPKFNTSHLNGLLDVYVPAHNLSFLNNPGVQSRAVWGTHIYTDDSDIVAILVHSGWYQCIDAPKFRHSVSTTKSAVDKHRAAWESDPEKNSTPIPTTSPTPTDPIIPTPHPTLKSIPLHDLVVTLRVLPRLEKYTGTACVGLTDKDVVYSSRGWGGSHEGESICIVSVRQIPTRHAHPGVLRTTTIIRSPATTAIKRNTRKSGAIEWCSMRKTEGLLKRGKVVVSSVTGQVLTRLNGALCSKYSPTVLREWPRFLQDSLVDLTGAKPVDVEIPENVSYGLSGAELKKMEGWAYWRVRLSVPGTVLVLEGESRAFKVLEVERVVSGAATVESYKVTGVNSSAPLLVGLGEIEWRLGGVYVKGAHQVFEVDRFSFVKKDDQV
ncbi:Rxt3-domain-containing protein [Rhizoclosmatium globosum]|uniref:Rxt3-domain-containing protein n=1 Tax=Rhizoclosmatium globosum TaxID=329046 RepID=A0A1Y2CCT3_9FUNG|nr:Rxt3-domain-containing protein [Rhizoclosmatium globosum]|eukprot:ORY44707.1 Rxt3-domain-containing protein [Rhizoclosmatium globosum]